jgi:regulator of sigma E protease
LLFGGFVRLYGEEAEPEKAKDKKRAFWYRGKKQRLLVIIAGVVMNVLLALGIFGVLYSRLGILEKKRDKVTVVEIMSGSPAEKAGMAVGDRILKVEGQEVEAIEDFSRMMKSWGGLSVNILIESGETTALLEGLVEDGTATKNINLVPRKNPPEGEGAAGVVISVYPYVATRKCPMVRVECLAAAVRQGFSTTGLWVGRVFEGFRDIGKSLIAGKAPQGVSGPVGIYQLTGLVAGEGFWSMMELVAVLSVNLAVFNVLPFPALDGGRLFFIGLEWILRRRLPAGLEQKVNTWGMIILLLLMALVSFQDVIRLGWFK